MFYIVVKFIKYLLQKLQKRSVSIKFFFYFEKKEPMKILAISTETPDADWSNETETLKTEARRVLELYLSGFIREIYFDEEINAVIILECDSIKQAEELLSSLPLVKKGLLSFHVRELNPYTGYERIIEP